MGWRPNEVRECSLVDFNEAVMAWNSMNGQASGEMSSDDALALRNELGW